MVNHHVHAGNGMKALLAGGLIAATFAGALALQPATADAATVEEVEPNNSISEANTLELGKVVKGSFYNEDWDDSDDSDYYKFTVSKDGFYYFKISGDTDDVDVNVYDNNGNSLDIHSYKAALCKGTYYLQICSGLEDDYFTSNYTLKVTKTSASKGFTIASLKASKKKATITIGNIDALFSYRGYQVYYKAEGGSWKLAKTMSWSSTTGGWVKYTKSGLKSGKKYSFKIRSYQLCGKTKVYGSFSKAKTVKVK